MLLMLLSIADLLPVVVIDTLCNGEERAKKWSVSKEECSPWKNPDCGESPLAFSLLHIPNAVIRIFLYLQASKPEKVLPVNSLKLYLGVKKKMKPPTK